MNIEATSETSLLAASNTILQVMLVVGVICLASVLASLAVIFKKNGYAWWLALIPGYNIYIICRLGELSAWWMVVLAIPYLVRILGYSSSGFADFAQEYYLHGSATLVSLGVQLLIINALRKKLAAPRLYTIGCLALPLIFFPLLAIRARRL